MEDKSMPPTYPGFEVHQGPPSQQPYYNPQQSGYPPQQQGYPNQQQGYPQQQQGFSQPGYVQPVIVQTGGSMPVIIGGGCPSCRVGEYKKKHATLNNHISCEANHKHDF